MTTSRLVGSAALIGAIAITSAALGQQAAKPDAKPADIPRYTTGNKVTWDADGTLHIPEYAYPLSSFMSPELKKAYAQQVVNLTTWPGPPAMDAPMETWKAYWKEYDEKIMGAAFKRWKEMYPTTVEHQILGGVPVDVVVSKAGIAPANKNRVLINLHGGGFYTGAGVGGLVESIPVAGRMRIKVITVDYRESPQNKFPAASEDVAAVYADLLKTYKPQNIGIYGCSSGGTLTAQAAAWFQTHDLPNPGGVGVFCAGGGGGPGDLTPWGAGGVFSPPHPRPETAPTGYLSTASKDDPMVSPVLSPAVMAKFPPTLIISGTRSGDMSPAAYLHTRLLKAGVDSQLYIIEGGWHGVFSAQPDTPESADTYAYMVKWFDKHLGKAAK